jgi:7-carboxy-7-deazaguanine synthase
MKIKVSEYFFSIQGEGISAGVPCLFIRFPGCNLMCGGKNGELLKEGKATWWCDTEALWRQSKEVDIEEIIESLSSNQRCALHNHQAHIVFTGGEPCLSVNEEAAIEFLDDQFFDVQMPFVELETNGTVDSYLFDKSNQINCSPKLSNSGIPESIRFKPDILSKINAKGDKSVVQFKFVVSTMEDIKEVGHDFVEELKLPRDKIVLMPGVDRRDYLAEETRFVWEVARDLGLRMCSRLQILVYDKMGGV